MGSAQGGVEPGRARGIQVGAVAWTGAVAGTGAVAWTTVVGVGRTAAFGSCRGTRDLRSCPVHIEGPSALVPSRHIQRGTGRCR
ncbi:hypothetical protein DEI82_01215 [Curtobacterium sp. MCBD17_019]|nr:hypothetical protein DEI82_01215 [Curtobacterium sp. MCBD17_019]